MDLKCYNNTCESDDILQESLITRYFNYCLISSSLLFSSFRCNFRRTCNLLPIYSNIEQKYKTMITSFKIEYKCIPLNILKVHYKYFENSQENELKCIDKNTYNLYHIIIKDIWFDSYGLSREKNSTIALHNAIITK